MKKFSYNFFTKHRFKKEFKRQQKLRDEDKYHGEINTKQVSYWIDVNSSHLPDLEIEDYLSEFAKQFTKNKKIQLSEDLSEVPPSDIYPVY